MVCQPGGFFLKGRSCQRSPFLTPAPNPKYRPKAWASHGKMETDFCWVEESVETYMLSLEYADFCLKKGG